MSPDEANQREEPVELEPLDKDARLSRKERRLRMGRKVDVWAVHSCASWIAPRFLTTELSSKSVTQLLSEPEPVCPCPKFDIFTRAS